jgi:hypothetical protein
MRKYLRTLSLASKSITFWRQFIINRVTSIEVIVDIYLSLALFHRIVAYSISYRVHYIIALNLLPTSLENSSRKFALILSENILRHCHWHLKASYLGGNLLLTKTRNYWTVKYLEKVRSTGPSYSYFGEKL